MIISAKTLWSKFNTASYLGASEWGVEMKNEKRFSHVSYSGHKVSDGTVRIYAQFCRPIGDVKRPAILLLPDAGEVLDRKLMEYFVEKGYAVLMPDYSGKMSTDGEGVMRTVYPESLRYANYETANLYEMPSAEAEKTAWFEWTYVALYSIEYLKSRSDIGSIGVVGVRTGGDIAWQTMPSPDVKCGVPINSIGWHSYLNMAKFGENIVRDLSDEKHRYIAAVEPQSYAPYVQCPVLMLCALRDLRFDYDRAYDTYSRIGNEDGNALVYAPNAGACIGPNALIDMDLFLEKNLKGREIYIPATLNVSVAEADDGLQVKVECDKEGILEEVGIYYAEADIATKSSYRQWIEVLKLDGTSVKNGEVLHTIKPFSGAKASFVFAYAKYINGFRVMSKIVAKKLTKTNALAVKNRMLFSGKEMDCFFVADYKESSIGKVLLTHAAVPKQVAGYGDIKGVFSKGGIKTYKISSPMYVPNENALLAFDVYSPKDGILKVTVEAADVEKDIESYSCEVAVKGGGKWKRIILKSVEFKGTTWGMPLKNFYDGKALIFNCDEEENCGEFAITNILWL